MRPFNNIGLVFAFALAFFCSNSSLAQTALVRGSVTDATTGESLIQAAIMYGSDVSNKGTLTDFDGNYSVELAPGEYTLKISYVGYGQLKKRSQYLLEQL